MSPSGRLGSLPPRSCPGRVDSGVLEVNAGLGKVSSTGPNFLGSGVFWGMACPYGPGSAGKDVHYQISVAPPWRPSCDDYCATEISCPRKSHP